MSDHIEPLLHRHTQDAAFYWQQLDTSLAESGLRAERALHFARLLAAHLEGLAVAGKAALPLTLQALARWRKPGEAFVAGHAALCADDQPAASATVLKEIARVPDLLLRGLIGALASAPQAAARRFIETAWARALSTAPVDRCQMVAAMRACALRGIDVPAPVLTAALSDPHPALRAAACRASGASVALLPLLHEDPELSVRAEAAIALGLFSTGAAAVLRQAAVEQAQRVEQASGWNRLQAQRRLGRWLRHLAGLLPAGHVDVPALLAQLPLREALRFVLFHGDPAQLSLVISALDHPEQGRWAGFVWQSLTGVDLVGQGLTLAEPPVDLDAGLSRSRQDGDLGLALPDVAAVMAHPATLAVAAQTGQRLLLGRVLSIPHLAALLRIESNQPQLLRAVAAHAWNVQDLQLRIQLRAPALTLLKQDLALPA